MAGKSEEQLNTPIINRVLCYTSTARHSIRQDDIIRVCMAFYSDEDIIKAKDLLCELIKKNLKEDVTRTECCMKLKIFYIF